MNLYKICEQKLKYLNYSESTLDIYMRHVEDFIDIVSVPPSRLKSELLNKVNLPV